MNGDGLTLAIRKLLNVIC